MKVHSSKSTQRRRILPFKMSDLMEQKVEDQVMKSKLPLRLMNRLSSREPTSKI